jgi:uncharacterized protein YbcI
MSLDDRSGSQLAHGDVLTTISDGLVALLKEFYGRGPTRAKSYYADDLVVCVLRGGFSRVEQTLLEGGRGSAVIEQRVQFQQVMRGRFQAVVEAATGRQVIGFMSGNQQQPDMMCEVFVLAPGQVEVRTGYQLRDRVLGAKHGEPGPDSPAVIDAGELRVDGAKALARRSVGDVGKRADELVSADPDDLVE